MHFWKSNIKIKFIGLLVLVFCAGILSVHAQNQILFLNASQGKLIKAKEGDQLSIRYRGYLGQTEYFMNTITAIGDSTFTLGIPFSDGTSMFGKKVGAQLQCKEIRYTDVLEFRRSGIGRTFLKSGLSIGAAVGSLLLLDKLYTKNEVNDFAKIGISLGVGLSMRFVINLALPDKPNHKVKDGWQINPVKN